MVFPQFLDYRTQRWAFFWACLLVKQGTPCTVFQWLCLHCTHTHTLDSLDHLDHPLAQGYERIWIWIYRFIPFHLREVKIMYIFRNYDCEKGECKSQPYNINIEEYCIILHVSLKMLSELDFWPKYSKAAQFANFQICIH